MSDFRAGLGEEYRLFTGRKKRVGDYRGRLQGGRRERETTEVDYREEREGETTEVGDYRSSLQGGGIV